MSVPGRDELAAVLLTADTGARHDVTRPARQYVMLREKAARANLAWLESNDDAHLRKRDDCIFRSVDIMATTCDLLGHEASKRFAIEADRLFGPVRFWPR